MPTINGLDLGPYGVTAGPSSGQLGRSVVIEGSREVSWAGGSRARTREMVIEVQAQAAIGGQPLATNQREANRYLVQQLIELAANSDLSPAYIQWRTGGGITIFDPQDGWWRIDDVEPLAFTWLRTIPVRIKATAVALGRSLPASLARSGGQLSTNYTGTGTEISGFPVGSTNQPATAVARTGAEGSIPLSVAPSIAIPASLPFTPPATVAGLFLGGCRVYDTVTAGGNAVPTTGAFTHASWVEVFAPDHRFEGDCIITNGLHLYLFQAGVASQIGTCYLWSTAQATPGWLQFATLVYNDNAGASGTLRSFALQRVGLEEVRLVTGSSTANGNWAEVAFRLQRGQYFARVDLRPLTQAAASGSALQLLLPAAVKIIYNNGKIGDPSLSESPGVQTDYGYGAAFISNTAYPFITGWLYQTSPGAAQPGSSGGSVVNTGDSTSLAQNAVRSYGFFAVPFGTSTTTTDKLQVEAERGTYGSWVQVADAAASGGQAEKLPSGTASGAGLDVSAALWQPPSGAYGVWFRVRVTSTAGSTGEVSLGIKNYTDSTTTLGGPFAPNQTSASYIWIRAIASWSPTAGKNYQVYAISGATLGTDWFIDEVALVPQTLSPANTGPQELFQQFLMDIERELQRSA